MNKATLFLVRPEEIQTIIDQTMHEEMNYCWDMYQKYWEMEKDKANMKTYAGRHWETMCILSFMFNVGKICGIRSERARRREKV